MRIGIGYDVHAFEKNRPLIIGGCEIPYSKGLLGHSDADVLIHAIMDAILGAMALKDIGYHFPDTDPLYKDIDSRELLRRVYEMMDEKGFVIGNIDSVIVAQEPKMAPYIDVMRSHIAKDLHTEVENIGIKATTTEKMGFTGRREGIAAQAVALLEKK